MENIKNASSVKTVAAAQEIVLNKLLSLVDWVNEDALYKAFSVWMENPHMSLIIRYGGAFEIIYDGGTYVMQHYDKYAPAYPAAAGIVLLRNDVVFARPYEVGFTGAVRVETYPKDQILQGEFGLRIR